MLFISKKYSSNFFEYPKFKIIQFFAFKKCMQLPLSSFMVSITNNELLQSKEVRVFLPSFYFALFVLIFKRWSYVRKINM